MRQMKDSGIAWVGEIPQHWDIRRTKYCFASTKEIAGIRADDYERLALTMNGVIRRSKDDNTGLQPEKFETYQILRPNELVFKLIDLQNISTSRVGLSPYLGLVSPAYIILKSSNGKVLPRFAEKYFLMLWKNQIFNALGDAGVRSSLNIADLLEIPLAFPPLIEQQRIADFLDRECEKIDKLKADIQAQIDTLEQYKHSVITEVVTHGLNPDVPMKDSGIAWVGSIPQQWNVGRIGGLYELRNQKVSDKDFMPLSVTMKGVVPQLETAAKTNDGDNRKLVRKGDFAINSRSDRRGSCGISDYDGSVSLINTILKSRRQMCAKYYNWLFHTPLFADEFYKWGHGIVDDLWTTSWNEMKRISIPLPPIHEQKTIAEYLNKKCAEIEQIIADKKAQFETLDDYKKSLIYEYVTGKKEVPINEL